MAVHVLVFDPMNMSSIAEFEEQLDSYLIDGWEILHALAGNRAGVAEGVRNFRNSSKLISPEHKDYVVFILRNAMREPSTLTQSAYQRANPRA